MDINQHYSLLLGLGADWKVSRVAINVPALRVDIFVEFCGQSARCPKCGAPCRLHDHAPERTWRHLDAMQFSTTIHCALPRVKCGRHGALTLAAPWAGPRSRFTRLFEAFAISVIRACRSVEDARKLLRLGWGQVRDIMAAAVERGLGRRGDGEVAWIGLDEKSFGKGQKYVSVMADIEGGRILDVAEGRSEESALALIAGGLGKAQREMVCGVAMDMSAPFEKAVRRELPDADIVFDRFHVSKLLSDAVDSVRRSECARLRKENDRRLANTRYLWLKGLEHLSPEASAELRGLLRQSLRTAAAWGVKELFGGFWTRRGKEYAETFFRLWHREALATKLAPVVKAAQTLARRLGNLLTYYDCYITNAVTEGFNSKIQSIKANARGFRNFQNYRIAILFHCGKLDLQPL